MTGLVIKTPAGVVMLDMTMNISQHQGSVVTGSVDGAVSLPALPTGKTRFFLVVPLVDLQAEKGKKPGVTIAGNTLSWAYSYATNGWGYFSANCRIYYGYY